MTVPEYSDLPLLGDLGIRHSRGLLPVELGTLSFTSPSDVISAAGLIRLGISIPLNLPVDAFDPPLFDRTPLEHRVVEVGRNEAEDVLGGFNPQASSQLDGLAHVRAREYGYYDGSSALGDARESIGMHHWAQRGIAARGVLLDATTRIPHPFSGSGLEPDDLRALAEQQGVELRRGDLLLIRTRWAADYLALSPAERGAATAWSGLSASEAMAGFLWDTGIAAVGSDNPAVENAPGSPTIGSLHRRLLPSLGMPMLELLELEHLTAQCSRADRWEFLFVSVPLNVHGAVSSPANAMAIL